MLHKAHRTCRALRSALLFGSVTAAAFGTLACTAKVEESPAAASTHAPKASAEKPAALAAKPAASESSPTAKAAVAAGETVKKAAEATGDNAKKAGVAVKEAAAKTGAAVETAAAGAAAQDKAKTTQDTPKPTPPGGHTPPAPAAKTADGKPAPTPDAKPVPNPQDPNNTEVDPNSKAKLTYEFGSDTKNFGKVMQGDVLNHKFQLQSSGEEDLVIKQAKPTCGCTVAQITVQQADGTMGAYTFGGPIPPGRKIEISATLHTQNKRGHASSRINVFTNDPRGQSQFGLEAEVDPFFQVNPVSINFNTLSAKDTATDRKSVV